MKGLSLLIIVTPYESFCLLICKEEEVSSEGRDVSEGMPEGLDRREQRPALPA